jgi:hypothetical protein
MKKATVTYTAPKGDNKVVEMLGHTFYDGKGTEVVCDENQMKRLQNNQLFKVGAVSDYEPPKETSKDADAPDDQNKSKEESHGKTHR